MGTAFAGAYDACVLAGLISLSKELENNFSLKKPDFCACKYPSSVTFNSTCLISLRKLTNQAAKMDAE